MQKTLIKRENKNILGAGLALREERGSTYVSSRSVAFHQAPSELFLFVDLGKGGGGGGGKKDVIPFFYAAFFTLLFLERYFLIPSCRRHLVTNGVVKEHTKTNRQELFFLSNLYLLTSSGNSKSTGRNVSKPNSSFTLTRAASLFY